MRLLELFRPFQVVATRRITEEEQISVQVFTRSREDALAHMAAILDAYATHRVNWNNKVVLSVQTQVRDLEAKIETRGEEVRELDREIEHKRSEIAKMEKWLKEKKERAGLSAV